MTTAVTLYLAVGILFMLFLAYKAGVKLESDMERAAFCLGVLIWPVPVMMLLIG